MPKTGNLAHPGAAEAARAPKSFVFFYRELIGFAEGAQNRKSDPGGSRNLQETLGAGGGMELLFYEAFSNMSCLELQFHEAFLNIASIECDTVERNY